MSERARTTCRRRLVRVLLALVLTATAVVVVLWLPPVQRALSRWLFGSLTDGTAWAVAVEDLRVNPLAGALSADTVEILHGDDVVVSAGAVEAEWDWTELVRAPRRVNRLLADDVVVDLRQLPEADGDARSPTDPFAWLSAVELGEVSAGIQRVTLTVQGVDRVDLRGGTLAGSLVDGRADVKLAAESLTGERADRVLEVGPVSAEGVMDGSTVRITSVEVDGDELAVRASGQVDLDDPPALTAQGRIGTRLFELASWWNSELARRLEPRGELRLAGKVGWTSGKGLSGELRHRGEPVGVAGYPIETVRFSTPDGRPRIELADPSWGIIDAGLTSDDRLAIRASLDDAEVREATRRLPDGVADRVPAHLNLSGDVDIVVGWPLSTIDPPSIEGEAELDVSWQGGEAALDLSSTSDGVRLREVMLRLPKGQARAQGAVSLDGDVSAVVEIDIESVAAVKSSLAPWLPSRIAELPLTGGPVTGKVKLHGSWLRPNVDGEMIWLDPGFRTIRGRRMEGWVDGVPDEMRWRLVVVPTADSRLTARGTADLERAEVSGTWRLTGTGRDLLPTTEGQPPFDVSVDRFRASGRFDWQGGLRSAALWVIADEVVAGRYTLDGLVSLAGVRDGRLTIRRLEARSHGASLRASASIPLSGTGDLSAEVRLSDLAISRVSEIPSRFNAFVDGRIDIGGTVAEPTADFAAEFQPEEGQTNLPAFELLGTLRRGVIEMEVAQAGPMGDAIEARARLPLGGFPMVRSVAPDAPVGPLRATATADGLELEPILAVAGLPDLPLAAATGLRLDATWSLTDPSPRRLTIELPGLEATSTMETIRAVETPRIEYRSGRFVLEPMRLAGETSRLDASGRLELDPLRIGGRIDAVLGGFWIRLLPVDIDATGLVEASIDVQGDIGNLSGSLELAQPEGELVVRGTPVQISNLSLDVDLADGVWMVNDGSATVNRGRVLVGGEWNTTTGQGVIFELQEVAFLTPQGILTRWNGDIVVEPAAGRIARIVGDAELDKGRWDRDVNFSKMIFGGSPEGGTTGAVLYDVVLDLEVVSRGTVDVENNLGGFEVTWDVLDIEGTLAEPLIEGELILLPGGVISLSGRTFEIARGSVRFPGEPGAVPEVEIVPQRDSVALGTQGDGLDVDALARRGVASSIGSALGLRNTTLEPAAIAVETLTDPSTNYLVSQQIGRYIALFLAADLSDVQQRSTIMQLYNWRAVPGLALQALHDSRAGTGFAAIESLSWGGTVDEQVRVRKVKLEGAWPVSKRRLKKTARIERGQPFDPFLVFVGRVCLERALAREGYYRPRVEGWAGDGPKLRKISFRVDQGPHEEVRFEGYDLPKEIRQETTAQYVPFPLEQQAFADMEREVQRHLDAVHHPRAEIDVARRNGVVTVAIDPGPRVELEGPSVHGVDRDAAARLERVFGSPGELAELARRASVSRERAERLLELDGYVEPSAARIRLEPLGKGQERVHLEVEHEGRATLARILATGPDPLNLAGPARLGIEEGMPVQRDRLEEIEGRLASAYRRNGYIDVEIEATVNGAGLQRTLEITLDPGTQKRVGQVTITGRRHLSEKVIRRGLELEPGELVKRRKINDSIVQLASFGPIERIDLRQKPGGPGAVDFEIHVTERARWTAGAGIRWNEDTGLLGLIDLRDDSLFARGFSLNLRGL